MPPRTAQLIAERIASQAVQEGSPLSDVECKMLLFSETSPTFPDMLEVNEIFDRDYDRNEYETKISNLIGHLRSSDRMNPDANHTWTEAVRSLRGQDYYFMIMLDKAGGRERPRGDFVRLVATAVAMRCGCFGDRVFPREALINLGSGASQHVEAKSYIPIRRLHGGVLSGLPAVPPIR